MEPYSICCANSLRHIATTLMKAVWEQVQVEQFVGQQFSDILACQARQNDNFEVSL